MENKIIRPFVEINIAEHCNLTCSQCDHYSPYLPKVFADIDETERDLHILREVLHANHLLLLGGEPLLHPRFDDFCEMAKKSNISHQLVLVTNGTLLHRMSDKAWRTIDGVRISKYPGAKFRLSRSEIERKAKSHNVWIWESDVNSFDITEAKAEIHDESLRKLIFTNCFMGQICNTVRDGYFFRCPPSTFLSDRLSKRGVQFDNYSLDGVRIANNDNLKYDLESLLFRSDPLDACRFCLGSLGKKQKHRLMNNKEIEESAIRGLDIKFNFSDIRDDFIF